MKPNPDTTLPYGRIPRLYHDANLDDSGVVLDGKQAHYLRQVLRLKRGHSVVIFDGQGRECIASITLLTRDGGELAIDADIAPIPESALEINLLQAVAKSEAMDSIIQKATELGVHSIAPVVTEFCVVKLDEQRSQSRLEHWRRIARSACEQSGRHRPTVIAEPAILPDRLANLPTASARFALDPGAQTAFRAAAGALDATAPLNVLVGPEGGLSQRDLSYADRAGFSRVTLGRRILRTETAAITACALAQALSGDLG